MERLVLMSGILVLLVINVTQVNETAYLFILQPAGDLSAVPGSSLTTDYCNILTRETACTEADCPKDPKSCNKCHGCKGTSTCCEGTSHYYYRTGVCYWDPDNRCTQCTCYPA